MTVSLLQAYQPTQTHDRGVTYGSSRRFLVRPCAGTFRDFRMCSKGRGNRKPSLAAHESIPRLYPNVRLIGEESVYPQREKAFHFSRQIAVRCLVGA